MPPHGCSCCPRSVGVFSRYTQARPFVAVDLAAVTARGFIPTLKCASRKPGRWWKWETCRASMPTLCKCGNFWQNLIGNGLKFHKKGMAPAIRVSRGKRGLAGRGQQPGPVAWWRTTASVSMKSTSIIFLQCFSGCTARMSMRARASASRSAVRSLIAMRRLDYREKRRRTRGRSSW